MNFDVAPGFYTPEALEDEARNWIAVVRYNYNLGIVSDFIIKNLGISFKHFYFNVLLSNSYLLFIISIPFP